MSESADGFTSDAERQVAKIIGEGLCAGDRQWANLRVSNDAKNYELDFVLALPEAGFAVLEVKGGQITHDGTEWRQTSRNGRSKPIEPVRQAREGMYALRAYVERDPRWGSRGRVRWAHAVVFPYTALPDDFALTSCPRYMAFGREDLDNLVESIASIAVRQRPAAGCRRPRTSRYSRRSSGVAGCHRPTSSGSPSNERRWPTASPSNKDCCSRCRSSCTGWRSAAVPVRARPGWRWSRRDGCARTASVLLCCATRAGWPRTSLG